MTFGYSLSGYLIEEMKDAVTNVIDTLAQEDFNEPFQKLLERYNKCIAAEEDYFEGGYSFMCVLSINVPIRKKSGTFFNDPRLKPHCIVIAEKCFKLGSIQSSLLQTLDDMLYSIFLLEFSFNQNTLSQ